MTKTSIHTDRAPKAIGTYSQAIASGNTVYCSGQIALHPETNTLRAESFETEVRQIFANLDEVARAAGGSLASVAKLTVYLTDLSNFAELNTLMAEYMKQPYPARAAVGVSALPLGVSVEIDAILVLEN